MSEKVNQRVMLTKRLIKESLVQMLAEKNIYSVSIRELCERAGINRTTFYKHYGSQYDVLLDIENELLTHVQEALAKFNQDASGQMDAICAYLDKNAELLRLLTDNNIDPQFPEKLFNLPQIRQLLELKLGDRYDAQSLEYVVTFVINGGYHVIRRWAGSNDREASSMIAALLLSLAEKVCQ